MNCRHCQREISDVSSFCPFCGAPQQIPSYASPGAPKRLKRSVSDRKIAGVCGGIAEYFDIDSTIVRLIWVLLVILPIPLVPAFLGYFIAWIVMPKAPLYLPAASQQPPIIIPNSAQTA
jgi:phage shock protein C